MAGQLSVRVITPERIVADATATSVRIPATDGSMGIFPRHAGMIAALDVGLLLLRRDGGAEEVLFVSGGFAEVREDTVRVLTAAGEPSEEIDVERAREAEQRARERLDEAARRQAQGSTVDFLRAEASLRRAMMRIRAGARGR